MEYSSLWNLVVCLMLCAGAGVRAPDNEPPVLTPGRHEVGALAAYVSDCLIIPLSI